MSNYKEHLFNFLYLNFFNYYDNNIDNWYYETNFGKKYKTEIFKKLKVLAVNIFYSIKKNICSKEKVIKFIENTKIENYQNYNFEFLYNLLERKEDKDLLIRLIAYRILGQRKVFLTDVKRHNFNLQKAYPKTNFNDYIQVSEQNKYKLYKTDFRPFGNYSLYSTPLGYAATVYENCYKIPNIISVEKGDIVLDCGAYCCDTAIIFADMLGEQGQIYAYEFIEDNLKLCEKNLEINPELREKITIIKKPLSDKVGEKLYFTQNSSCSTITTQKQDTDKFYTSTTIDQTVKEYNLNKVNFIKMDIEGSEVPAIKGAINTIKQFKPKLAISVYHKPDDLDVIPKLIKSINPNYKFYLGYTGVSNAEYVLFAKDYSDDKN